MKVLIWIIILALIGWGVYALMSDGAPEVMESNADENGEVVEAPVMEDGTLEEPKTVTVTFTSTGYKPKEITVNAGDTVQFLNQSSTNMWPASAMHPTHEVYDGTNLATHCATGATPSFDACKNIAAGGTYSFTFSKTGTWRYHDHSNTAFTGSVIVQ